MDQPPQLPSDSQLLVRTRLGLPGTWNELVRRHGEALTAVAGANRRRGSQRDVTRALGAFHSEILGIGTPCEDSSESQLST